jgi:hypothetical protein
MRSVAPAISVNRAASPPIVGAALLALDFLGAPPEGLARAREEVGKAAQGAERSPIG